MNTAERSSRPDSAAHPVVVAVDIMGTDRGPDAIVRGLTEATARDGGISCIAVGTPEALDAHVAPLDCPRIRSHPAEQIIHMTDDPSSAVRAKRRSSTIEAMRLVRHGAADAVVSGANTGAVMLAAAAVLRRLPAVIQPALATVVSSYLTEPSVLVDCGGSTHRSAARLEQYARFGVVFARVLLGVEEPRIGLLANGTEDGKGDDPIRQAHERLRQLALAYDGLVEPHALYAPGPEVIVTDGLTGNLVLKAVEATWRALSPLLDRALVEARAGTAEQQRLAAMGMGGVVMGVGGTVVKTHGTGADRQALGAVLLAASARRAGLAGHVAEAFGDG